MKKKKVLIIIVITLSIIVCAAIVFIFVRKTNEDKFIPDNSGPRRVEHEPDEPLIPTFRIWHSFEGMKDDYPKGFENFKPADYEFEIAYFSTDEMRDKLLSAKNNGTLPDVVFVDPTYLPELVRLDILLPLDTELDNFSAIHSNLYSTLFIV